MREFEKAVLAYNRKAAIKNWLTWAAIITFFTASIILVYAAWPWLQLMWWLFFGF